jgi:hypothetical protein
VRIGKYLAILLELRVKNVKKSSYRSRKPLNVGDMALKRTATGLLAAVPTTARIGLLHLSQVSSLTRLKCNFARVYKTHSKTRNATYMPIFLLD